MFNPRTHIRNICSNLVFRKVSAVKAVEEHASEQSCYEKRLQWLRRLEIIQAGLGCHYPQKIINKLLDRLENK